MKLLNRSTPARERLGHPNASVHFTRKPSGSVPSFLKNRNFILPFGIVMGLVFGEAAQWAKPLILPLLGLIMTLSTTQISFRSLMSSPKEFRRAGVAALLNYLIFGAALLLSATMLIDDREILDGFVMVAAAPPAVAIIPFTVILTGNVYLSMVATIWGYLGSMVIAPAMAYWFLGESLVSPWTLLLTLVELIFIPFVLSRIVLRYKREEDLAKWRGTAVNWSFSVVLFTVVGLNRSAFIQEKELLPELFLIGFICSFGLGWVVDVISRRLAVSKKDRISYILSATLKNAGFSAAICLTFLSPKSAIPSAVMSVYLVLYFMFLARS